MDNIWIWIFATGHKTDFSRGENLLRAGVPKMTKTLAKRIGIKKQC